MGYTEKKRYKWLKEDYIDYSNDLESELSQVKFESQQKLKQITNELTGELEDNKNKLQSAEETLKGYRLIEDVSNASIIESAYLDFKGKCESYKGELESQKNQCLKVRRHAIIDAAIAVGIIFTLWVITATWGMTVSKESQTLQDALDQRDTQISTLTDQVRDLSQRNSSLQTQVDSLSQENTTLKDEMQKLTSGTSSKNTNKNRSKSKKKDDSNKEEINVRFD